MCGNSGSVSNCPERSLPRRLLTHFVVPSSNPVLRSNPMPKLTLLCAKRPTAPTIRPAPARWALPQTQWRSWTRTHGFWVWSGCAWSTPPSCPVWSAGTWMRRPSWSQKRRPIRSEVVLLLLIRRFLCTNLLHLKHRDEQREEPTQFDQRAVLFYNQWSRCEELIREINKF